MKVHSTRPRETYLSVCVRGCVYVCVWAGYQSKSWKVDYVGFFSYIFIFIFLLSTSSISLDIVSCDISPLKMWIEKKIVASKAVSFVKFLKTNFFFSKNDLRDTLVLSLILSHSCRGFEEFFKNYFLPHFLQIKKNRCKAFQTGNKFFSSNLHFTLCRDNKIASAHCDSASASIARAFGAFSTSFPFSFLCHYHFFLLCIFPRRLLAFYRRDWHSCAFHGDQRELAAPFPSTLSSTIRCDGENAGLRPVRMRISPPKFKLCIRGNGSPNYSNNF